MPQGPIQVLPYGQGTKTAKNINAATTIKNAPGLIDKIIVTVAGSTAGAVYDDASTADVLSTANEIAPIPTTTGPVQLSFPCANGITVVPGSGQALTVVYR